MKSLLTKTKRLFPIVIAFGTMTFIGCTDNKYDFNEVDYTIGVGSDGLSLPGSTTDTIYLSDVLELSDKDCVKTIENGDYVFIQNGNAGDVVNPKIDGITVAKASTNAIDFELDFTDKLSSFGAKGKKAPISNIEIKEESVILNFNYEGDKPKEIKELENATITESLTININFPTGLKAFIKKFDNVTLELPSYMTIKETNGLDINGSKITLKDVPTNNNLKLNVNIIGLNFKAKGNEDLGELKINGDKIHLDGKIRMSLAGKLEIDDITSIAGLDKKQIIKSSMEMSDIRITSARGKFAPQIDLKNLGNINITGIPDFLTDNNVKVDLFNPQIYLTVESDMNVAGIINGTITSYKNGKTVSVKVEGLKIHPNQKTEICICRHKEGIDNSKYDIYEVPNLSSIIETIPDKIVFDAEATADASVVSEFEFDHDYKIKPNYSITAPIAFAENAKIVYTESFDGLCKDLEDITLADGAQVEITAKVESRLPMHLDMEVTPMDVKGNDISKEFEISVNAKITGTQDEKNPALSDIKVIAKPKNDAALHKLDGFKFTISGTAKSENGVGQTIVGKTLNAKKHSLVAKDIVIKLTGKAIVDLN